MKIKLNGKGWFPHSHLILQFLPLIGHNLLLVYYRSEYKGNLQIRPLLHLGPNVITDKTFITLGFKILLRMELLLRLGPNVITDGTFITLGSSYYTCVFYSETCSSAIFYFQIITFIRPCNTHNKLRCVSNLRIDFLVNFLMLFPSLVLSKLYPVFCAQG